MPSLVELVLVGPATAAANLREATRTCGATLKRLALRTDGIAYLSLNAFGMVAALKLMPALEAL